MNDPFAMLNPIDKPKTAPVYNPPPSVPVAPLHPVGGGYGGAPAPGVGMGMPHAPMGMGMGMGPGMGTHMGGMPGGMPHGMGPGMGQGMPPGIGHGMGPGMGGGMPGGMPQQAPIMYDNIKQLLEQKPKPSGAMRDDAGMDFLEHLGTTKANSVSVTSPTAAAVPAVDPFGGPAPAPPTVSVTAPPVSLAGFSFPGETTASPPTTSPSNSTKSSALADRLANGRRKTQEMQRESLGFNAGSFSPSSGAPKISLKELAPPTSNKSPSNGDRETRAPSLEDFASGKSGFQESDPFGMSAAPSGGRSSRTNSGSTSNQSKSTPAPATASYTSSASGREGGSFFADSDADFEKKLNGGAPSGSSRQLSSGNLDNATRTGSGGASAKTTMDFGW